MSLPLSLSLPVSLSLGTGTGAGSGVGQGWPGLGAAPVGGTRYKEGRVGVIGSRVEGVGGC
ncbi:hypothetical protein GCM10010428_40560 [Actinosynnema pretiosum subsp. pretiosum]